VLKIGSTTFPCLLGKAGRRFAKREGDGASPIGKWKLEQLYYRPDKMAKPRTALRCKPMKPTDGWCDAKFTGAYNRHVSLPYKGSHEDLWRKDSAYDVMVTTNHNQRPRIQNRGSAIFLHIINQGAKGTEGCIALSEKHLRNVLGRCSKHTYLMI
jgi:L,D-peptidoglycan transpeptidase YkuD (ErfK/YbiS/YcfS/YnhG family)